MESEVEVGVSIAGFEQWRLPMALVGHGGSLEGDGKERRVWMECACSLKVTSVLASKYTPYGSSTNVKLKITPITSFQITLH